MKLALDPRAGFPGQAPESLNPGEKDPEALKRVCRDFESLLVNSLFQEMRKTIPDDGYLESDMSMDFFEEILFVEAAREASRKGGFGLGRLLYEQLQDSGSRA